MLKIIETGDPQGLAGIDRETGVIYVGELFKQLPVQVQKFILFHELGHYVNDSSDEINADDFAIQRYAGTERGSIKAIYDAIEILPDLPGYIDRKQVAFNKLLQIDCEKFNNQKACKMLYDAKQQDHFLIPLVIGTQMAFGCPLFPKEKRDECLKQREQRREDRRERREERWQTNQDIKNAYEQLLAQMAGEYQDTSKGKEIANPQMGATPTNNNQMLMIGIAVVVAIIVILLIILKTR